MLIDHILEKCDKRYELPLHEQCEDCTYGGYCPRDCEKCLDYIHTPSHASCGAPKRKYDCVHMADFYTCKYSCRYTSEIMYALKCCRDIQSLRHLKVLSFGCGPCTDLFAIDALRAAGILACETVEYRGIDYSADVWQWIHNDIWNYDKSVYDVKFFYKNMCEIIHEIEAGNWTPNLVVFQYVFSDMQKNTTTSEITEFINTFADYFNTKVHSGTYIILNDVNLGNDYGGGRDSFDKLRRKIFNSQYYNGQFRNDNPRSQYYPHGYPYGTEFSDNTNFFDLSLWRNYSPFDTCASAQMIIKKVAAE